MKGYCQVWWLTPVIPATQAVEIRKITVQGHILPKLGKTPSQPTSHTWWFILVTPATREAISRKITIQAHPGQNL
jgi:hypothetical protein